jgi:hypothetical protein
MMPLEQQRERGVAKLSKKEMEELFEKMFRLPRNWLEWEIFAAAFGHVEKGEAARKVWEKDGCKPDKLPREVIDFCREQLKKEGAAS